jgi:hypothetical protein
MLYDAAANYGGGGYVSCQDLIRTWKEVSEKGEEGVATVTLEIEVVPATFHYFPSHPMDIIIVVDVKTNEISSKNTTIKGVNNTIKTITKTLWSAHPDSSISILPSTNMEDGLMKAYHQIKDLDGIGAKARYQRAVLLITDGLNSCNQEKCLETAQKIKQPADGNTLLFAIGMDTREQPWFASLVTAPDYYKEMKSKNTKSA